LQHRHGRSHLFDLGAVMRWGLRAGRLLLSDSRAPYHLAEDRNVLPNAIGEFPGRARHHIHAGVRQAIPHLGIGQHAPDLLIELVYDRPGRFRETKSLPPPASAVTMRMGLVG